MKQSLKVNRFNQALKGLMKSKERGTSSEGEQGPEEREPRSIHPTAESDPLSKEEKRKGSKPKQEKGKDQGERKEPKHKADLSSGDALSRLEELFEEAPEDENEEQEHGGERGKKGSELVEKLKKGGLKRQPAPETSPNSAANTVLEEIQEDMERFLKGMPDTKKEMEKQVMGYLGKLKYLALRKAERLLVKLIDVSPSEMIKLAKELTDMQLAMKWTRKLERVILENPSKLKRPGSLGGWSLLSRVQEMASNTKNEQTRDGRQSGIKKSNKMGVGDGSRDLELPHDDAPPVLGVGG